MKCHKIYKVEKSVCTAEQKIAYNYAFSYYDIFEKIRNSDNVQTVKADSYCDFIDMMTNSMMRDQKINKYNIDAIICSLRYGLFSGLYYGQIFTNYSDIGKCFSIKYSIE